jgi:hypothetical protein
MYLIKECPSCRNKIRFPIDRGVIKVKCPCGYAFTADPDKRELYINAAIDARPSAGTGRAASLFKSLREADLSAIKLRLINSLLDFKYSVQNFRLLPNSERAMIALKLAAAAAPFIILAYLVWRYASASSPAGGAVI